MKLHNNFVSKEVSYLLRNENFYHSYLWLSSGTLALEDIFIEIPEDSYPAPDINKVLEVLREDRGIYISSIPISCGVWESKVYLISDNKISQIGEIMAASSWKDSIEKQLISIYDDDEYEN